MKHLRQLGKRNNFNTQEELVTNTAELQVLESELALLQSNVEERVNDLKMWKDKIDAESNKPENLKAWGQPVCAKLNKLLHKYGIGRSATFGGDLDGNDCRRLMGFTGDIIGELLTYVLQKEDSRVQGISDEHISQMSA